MTPLTKVAAMASRRCFTLEFELRWRERHRYQSEKTIFGAMKRLFNTEPLQNKYGAFHAD